MKRMLLPLLLCALAAGQAPVATAVDAVGITVRDLDRSVRFFTEVLQCDQVGEDERAGAEEERLRGVFGVRVRTARLRLGREQIELSEFLAPRGRAIPEDARSNDRWFQHLAIVVRDMDQAYAWLRRHKVEHASSGPQRLPDWNAAAGGIRAFYFKDPDGHVLEVIWFPKGKGDPRWQAPAGERLFLGIDHTAIVVADTEASLRLYRDTLGLQVVGGSENWGTEQEHLNNVFGARLRITTLRAAQGPGVELLQYLAPGDGRPYPPDARANDLWHWETIVRAQRLDLVPVPGVLTWVSPGVVTRPEGDGGGAALTLKDPDGHVLQLRR